MSLTTVKRSLTARKGTNRPSNRAPIVAIGRIDVHRAVLLAALLVLTLALAPRAEAFVYWANPDEGTIGRANLDGTGVDQRFITGAGEFARALAVDASHVYWADPGARAIGRANLDGTGADPRFIVAAGDPQAVAVDGAHVYWANYDGAIGRG